MSIQVKEAIIDQEVCIQREEVRLEGLLSVPDYAKGVVLFIHGAGSNRFSPRNQHIAESLLESNFATLLINGLTQTEYRKDVVTGKLRHNVPLIAGRIDMATDWIQEEPLLESLPIAYFGSGTGAAAALVAAVQRPLSVQAVVCRSGRLDLATPQVLADVKTPCLLMVGEKDELVLRRNLEAARRMQCEKKLVIVRQATHPFEEPGKLDEAARHTFLWLRDHILF